MLLPLCLAFAQPAFSASRELPLPPRTKPAVPDDQPGLSRSLTTMEKRLKTAISKALAGHHKDARALARRSGDRLGADLVEWLRLSRTKQTSDFSEAASFLELHPDWPRQRDIRRLAESALSYDAVPALPDGALLAWFQIYPPLTGHGAATMAAAMERQGMTDEADRWRRHAWAKLPFVEKDAKTFLKRHRKVLSEADHYRRLDRLLTEKQYQAATRQAQRMGKGYPKLARARLALIRRRPGVDWAISQVPDALAEDPGLSAERIIWRYRKRRYEGVLELLEDPGFRRLDPTRVWQARLWAAREALDAEDPALAYRLAADHGVPGGLAFAEGEWLAGWIALHYEDDPVRAADHFARLYHGVKSDISRARGAHWAGEALSRLDRKEESAGWFEKAALFDKTFYGQLATFRLGRRLPAFDAAAPDQIAGAGGSSVLAQVVFKLQRLGYGKLVRTFLRHAAQVSEERAEFAEVIAIAERIDRTDLALYAAKKARQKGLELGAHLFPEIHLLSNRESPEEALVLAVIRQESAFDKAAVSPAGARGLMQLMPATAKITSRRIKEPYRRRWLTEDPDYNVRLGRSYLQQMVERFDGAYALALAAYNAGPHRVDRWLETYGDPRAGDIPLIYWIESIPFSETRNYVQRVLESLFVYRSRRGGGGEWIASIPSGGT